MAVLTITGMREYDFVDEETGGQVRGMSVYFISELLPDERNKHLKQEGFVTGKLPVKFGTELYKRMRVLDYSRPFEANVQFDIVPGSAKPVLSDISIPKK